MILTSEKLPEGFDRYTFNLVLLDCDTQVGETICLNADDSFTIFINSRLSREKQVECFKHALIHVRNNDWEKSDVNEIEVAAHNENF